MSRLLLVLSLCVVLWGGVAWRDCNLYYSSAVENTVWLGLFFYAP